ncbi:MAG: flagellar export protein FliJ [Spirochaeta sp.]
MRRFQFRLQHLLNMRTHLRKEVELRLGAVTAECNRLDDELAGLATRRLNAQRQTRDSGQGAVLLDITCRSGFISWVDQEAGKLRNLRAAAEEKRLKIVDEYHDALREEKILLKLQERRQEEYYADALRQEYKDVEDIVTDRYIRKGGRDGRSE